MATTKTAYFTHLVTTETTTAYFTHQYFDDKLRRATVCAILDNNTIRIGISVCSHKDMFNKAKGRIIAKGRALSKQALVVQIGDKKQIMNTLHETIINFGFKRLLKTE